MPATRLRGGNPVSLLTVAGKQVGVPLTMLAIRDGVVDTSRLDPTLLGQFTPLLRTLFQTGALVADPAPAPVVALKVTSRRPGSEGNAITLAFSNVTPDEASQGDTTLDATIGYADRRPGLTVASIGTELGAPSGGTRPGLIALTAAATGLPAAMPATALAAAAPGDPLEVAVPAEDGSGDAFTLQATGSDPLLERLTVAIEEVDTAAATFTLIVAIDHVATGVKLSDLDAALEPLLDVTPGLGGFAPPKEGPVTLTGGGDAQTSTATNAEANVLTD